MRFELENEDDFVDDAYCQLERKKGNLIAVFVEMRSTHLLPLHCCYAATMATSAQLTHRENCQLVA